MALGYWTRETEPVSLAAATWAAVMALGHRPLEAEAVSVAAGHRPRDVAVSLASAGAGGTTASSGWSPALCDVQSLYC